MTNVRPLFSADAASSAKAVPTFQTPILKSADGGGTSGGMDQLHDLDKRLSRLEGGNTLLQFAVGIVSAALLAGLALMVGVQLSTQQQISSLTGKVDSLPSEINKDILSLTSSFAEVIAAGRTQNVIEVQPAQPSDNSSQ